MRDGLAREEDASSARALNRGTVDIVEQAFDQVAGRSEVLQTLLVLNADRRTTKFIREANGGDIHFALLQRLCLGQLSFLVGAPLKCHSFFEQPIENRPGVGVADLLHGSIEGGLAQALFEYACGMQE